MANKEILSVLSGIENTDRVVKYCIQTPSCGRIERPIFWETESIRIDSSSESNRIDSNCELECTSLRRYTRPADRPNRNKHNSIISICALIVF